jgi:uncharacterized small protein (DUF1192 family)
LEPAPRAAILPVDGDQRPAKEDDAMSDPFFEEQPRRAASAHEMGQDLSLLSVEELSERIAQLQSEIARLEEARSSKLDSRRLADSFFKS